MRRSAVVLATLTLVAIGGGSAQAATVTISGTFAGNTFAVPTPSAPCLPLGAPCHFNGTGIFTGQTGGGDPYVAGYQSDLNVGDYSTGCTSVSGQINLAEGITD